MSMKKLALLGALTLVMAGCSSVNLDNPPVEDRSSGANATAGDSVVAKTSVAAPVDDGKASQAAIANVSRLVYFDYDSYVIKPEFQALIEAHAGYIKAERSRKVVIEGHTDERGGREYNLALGQRRAESVAKSLTLLGVSGSQLEAVSFGKERPAVEGHDEAAWSKNRRVELKDK